MIPEPPPWSGGVGAGLVPALVAKKQGTHKGCPYNDPGTTPSGVGRCRLLSQESRKHSQRQCPGKEDHVDEKPKKHRQIHRNPSSSSAQPGCPGCIVLLQV